MAKETKAAETEIVIKKCGIVMPISGFDGYTSAHWADVKEIINEAADKAGFDPNLVSYADETSVIHKTIINNLYDNEIVVVDVSGKNPNVMFELGIRLAFDKPTIIIKDDKTNYIFDTSIIDHLEYPHDLHYQSILKFKDKLSAKIDATYKKSTDSKYSSFLKNFGEFTLAKLDKTALPESEYIIRAIQELKNEIKGMKTESSVAFSALMPIENRIRRYWADYKAANSYLQDLQLTSVIFQPFANWLANNASKGDWDRISEMNRNQVMSIANSPGISLSNIRIH